MKERRLMATPIYSTGRALLSIGARPEIQILMKPVGYAAEPGAGSIAKVAYRMKMLQWYGVKRC